MSEDQDPMQSPDESVRKDYMKEVMDKVNAEIETTRQEARARTKANETEPVLIGMSGFTGGISSA